MIRRINIYGGKSTYIFSEVIMSSWFKSSLNNLRILGNELLFGWTNLLKNS